MAPWSALIRVLLVFENSIIRTILRSPGFHRGVRKIHDFIQDRKYGRDPNEPLRQGEATRDPDDKKFLSHFIDELRNQFRGTPTDPDAPPPSKPAASGGPTRDPNDKKFLSFFLEELRNQFRGTPTDPDAPPPSRTSASSDKKK